MRTIGFSTGALAKGDFRTALRVLRDASIQAVELSALRDWELEPLVTGIAHEDLSGFSYISVHAPSRYQQDAERSIVQLVQKLVDRGWPVIVHPDAIFDDSLWRPLGDKLVLENMDSRKAEGRTAVELERIFERFPKALFCFDAGHARQVDPTMSEGMSILQRFSDRLCQLHVSEVSTASHHQPLSMASVLAFRKLASRIPDEVPLILETPVAPSDLMNEMRTALEALPSRHLSFLTQPV